MRGAHSRRTTALLAALVAALTLAFAVPGVASAGGTGTTPGVQTGGGGETNGGTGAQAGGGNLARTGFDVWKLGVAGLVCIAGALVILRRPHGSRLSR